MLKTLESLIELARSRKNNPVSDSYTNKLLSDKSLSKEKVLEEINELIDIETPKFQQKGSEKAFEQFFCKWIGEQKQLAKNIGKT